MLLNIDKITVLTKDEKEILKDLSLTINSGEIHAIMGPNGTGKSTLSKVIMGNSDYTVINGDIYYKEESLKDLSVDERSRKGIFLAMQNPISIEGVTNSEFMRTALNSRLENKIGIYEFMKLMDKNIENLKMDPKMLHRSINQDFSGGERKKNEILQMNILKPNLILLDELDSGLDVDSLKIVCTSIKEYISEHKETSVLIITHYPRILEYLKPDYVHIMKNGNIVKTGDYNLALEIEKKGYEMINALNGESIHE